MTEKQKKFASEIFAKLDKNLSEEEKAQVMFMEGGKVVETAPSKQFFEQPVESRAREFIRTILENRQ